MRPPGRKWHGSVDECTIKIQAELASGTDGIVGHKTVAVARRERLDG
jgi:hypothetical protein